MSRGTISVERLYFGDDKPLDEKLRVAVNGVLVERQGRRIRLLGSEWDATTASMVAAALLELAEAAEAEPDPALLVAMTDTVADALNTTGDSEDIARAILAAFKVEMRRQS